MCRDSFLAGIMNLNCRSTNVWLYFPLSTIWFAFRAWLRCSEWRVKNDKNGGWKGLLERCVSAPQNLGSPFSPRLFLVLMSLSARPN